VIVSGNDGNPGIQQTVGFASIQCTPGDTSVQINTYNASGAATDRAFEFIAYRPGNNQILPASANPGATECTVRSGVVACV
jgi:hypothetical protein